ncbi:MAG: hypothetical protein HQM08_04100 [Candidatus Riflebacteria bacterium]|nr:hypothetical protein [Candidatus Riflebacteria bacterium]
MRIERLNIDSAVFGGTVLAIQDFDSAQNFSAFEDEYCKLYDPKYVSCKISLDQICDSHLLEKHQFHFIECQMRASKKIRKAYDVSSFTQYSFDPIKDERDSANVLEIAKSTFSQDRFSKDRLLPSDISGKRYQSYVQQSLNSKNEAVYKLVDLRAGKTVAFKTHRLLPNNEALLLLGGVHSDCKNFGIGVVNSYFEINALLAAGIRKVTTHFSAANHPILNLEIGEMGYHVEATFAVFRKIYRV